MRSSDWEGNKLSMAACTKHDQKNLLLSSQNSCFKGYMNPKWRRVSCCSKDVSCIIHRIKVKLLHEKKDNKHSPAQWIQLQVCHFSYVTLVTEGALIIFFPEKKMAGGAYRSRGAKWGEYGMVCCKLVNSVLGNYENIYVIKLCKCKETIEQPSPM